jgi:SAM-dependent methyltransferase
MPVSPAWNNPRSEYGGTMGIFDRSYFEKEFEREDPWDLNGSSFEHRKYVRQIDLIKSLVESPASILEIGCAEGTHTAMLAGAFPAARVVAVDISRSALNRAGIHCRQYSNIEFVEGDIDQLLKKQALPLSHYSVVLQSESLYYMFLGHLSRFRLGGYVSDLMHAVAPNGIFLTCNGYSGVTRMVISAYIAALKSKAGTGYVNQYQDWCNLRKTNWKYEIRAFRTAVSQSAMSTAMNAMPAPGRRQSARIVRRDEAGA